MLSSEGLVDENQQITNICCIGAGYVGGPTCSVIADNCPNIKVTIVDLNQERINRWNHGPLPIYEPGLDEIVARRRGRNLFFSCEVEKAIDEAQLIFISVNTPTKIEGLGKGQAADLQYVESCTRTIMKASRKNKIIVEKSTVPVRTAEMISKILNEHGPQNCSFQVLSNPEFLAEGTAIDDLQCPDRILIGCEQSEAGWEAQRALVDIYAQWVDRGRILTMNVWSSELSKLAANAMLAQRISSINALSSLCEQCGANVDEVSLAIGRESRIGSKFLKSSIGFGGSCFQKDVLNLVYLCQCYGLAEAAEYWLQVIKINEYQKTRFTRRIINALFGTVSGKKLAIFGFAYKKDTGDTRETPVLSVVDGLLAEGALVSIYDPIVAEKQIIADIQERSGALKTAKNVRICKDAYDCAKQADAVIVCTEWDEFKHLDYQSIYNEMRRPSYIFDGRLVLDARRLQSIGFHVYCIGK